MGVTSALYEYFNSVPFIIRAVWFIGVFFFVSLFFLVLSHNVLRYHLYGKLDKDKNFSDTYELLLIEFLSMYEEGDSYSDRQTEIISSIKKQVHKRHVRNAIVATLIKLKTEISGEFELAIDDLYREIDLKKYALSKLNSIEDFRLVNGIRQLHLFNVKEALEPIQQLLNHPKDAVRNEAQLYVVKIEKIPGLRFLDDLEKPLTEWNQIQILEILKSFQDQEIRDVSSWLVSDNKYVVMFALKLVKIYNLYDMEDSALKLLEDESKEIRIDSIKVLLFLNSIIARDIIIAKFDTLSLEEQIVFFQELHHVALPSDVTFIKSHVDSDCFEIKLEALELLNTLDIKVYKEVVKVMVDTDSKNIIKYLAS